MGRRQQKQLSKTKKKTKHKDPTITGKNNEIATTTDTKNQDQDQQQPNDGGSWLYADPDRIRYQHSRIRPYFSGCGRSVQETFESIRDGNMSFTDLPPIQVIVGPTECNSPSNSSNKKNSSQDSSPWYFSLNNRRLWVFKKCRTEGLLEHVGNVVRVRVRECKSVNESKRYTVENCAQTAKFLRERPRNRIGNEEDGHGSGFGDSDDTKEKGLLKGDGNELLSVGGDTAKKCDLSENVEKFTSRTHCGNDDENVDTDESQLERGVRDIDVNDSDESEDVITSNTPSYRNPFCIDSDSSSSEDDSV